MLQRIVAMAQVIPVAKVRYVLLVMISIWFLSLLADLVWMMFPAPQQMQRQLPTSNIATIPSSATAQSKASIDIVAMQAWYLFGSNKAQNPAAIQNENNQPAAPIDASLTNLQLVLLGCLESDIPEESYAIIQTPGKSELIKVGENIPVGDGVILARVLTDRVIINNRGRMESLLLYTDKETSSGGARPPVAAGGQKVIDQRDNPELSMMANNYRNQLMTNPMSLTDVIKVSIAKDPDGKIVGYRIRPGRDRAQFAQFGLQTGDIVTAINGVPLNDPTKAMEVYGQMRDAKEASFAVKRGTEEINLMVSLGQ